MIRRAVRNQQGLAMMAVLSVIFILGIITALILYLSGKEIALSAVRTRGAQSLAVAEGGAFSGRAALMAYMGADPIGRATISAALNEPTLRTWYANGDNSLQIPFGFLNFLILDGQNFAVNATAATDWIVFFIDWSLATPAMKLQFAASGTGAPPANPFTVGVAPVNTLGTGTYTSALVITGRAAPHSSCIPGPSCFVHRLTFDQYQYNFTYSVISDGRTNPSSRRRVTLSRDFSVRVQRQNFARYSLFTHVHQSPGGGNIWFTNRTSFDGPVHTNGEFRFSYFPKYGTPDSQTPCSQGRVAATTLTSSSQWAWYYNNGINLRLQANENVILGNRRDAPVLPDCTVANINDDNDNPAASFTRGFDADTSDPDIDPIIIPPNSYSQKGIAVGRDPADTSTVTNLQVRQAVPELTDNTSAVPTGIYVPVADANNNGSSDAGESMGGGIYVQGDLTSLTLSLGGPSNNLAIYTLVQGGQTVTVTVDRDAGQTTVANSAWGAPQTRTFAGTPKGWQAPGNDNSAMLYVEGNINSLSGTIEEKDQAMITASGRIDISNHLQYEDPPDVTDPNDDPLNMIGIFSQTRDIRITAGAPDDLVVHGVMMAGQPGISDGYNSSVTAINYDTRPIQGSVHLIGGLIEEYYGAFGTFNSDGTPRSGFGRDFKYDRRMSRGFSPPYFPTTTLFELVEGDGLASDRPAWREAAP